MFEKKATQQELVDNILVLKEELKNNISYLLEKFQSMNDYMSALETRIAELEIKKKK
jgi:predicted  nucleic acid-binding Zn-ribbon protein